MKIYYSTQRPIAPGTYPKQGVVNIVNFDEKTYVKRLGRGAALTSKKFTNKSLPKSQEMCDNKGLFWHSCG